MTCCQIGYFPPQKFRSELPLTARAVAAPPLTKQLSSAQPSPNFPTCPQHHTKTSTSTSPTSILSLRSWLRLQPTHLPLFKFNWIRQTCLRARESKTRSSLLFPRMRARRKKSTYFCHHLRRILSDTISRASISIAWASALLNSIKTSRYFIAKLYQAQTSAFQLKLRCWWIIDYTAANGRVANRYEDSDDEAPLDDDEDDEEEDEDGEEDGDGFAEGMYYRMRDLFASLSITPVLLLIISPNFPSIHWTHLC